MTQHGRVPRTGELTKQPRSDQVEETWGDAVPHKSALEETFEEIKAAVVRKSNMRYGAYTALIVEFDDWCIHSDADRQALDRWARGELVVTAPNFLDVYLVSDRAHLAFHYRRQG